MISCRLYQKQIAFGSFSGLGSGSPNESLVGFMERIGCFKELGSSSIPDSLKKCHVLDAWYLTYFYKSYRSTYDPFDSIDMVTTVPPEANEWFSGKNQKIVKIWLVSVSSLLKFKATPFVITWIRVFVVWFGSPWEFQCYYKTWFIFRWSCIDSW